MGAGVSLGWYLLQMAVALAVVCAGAYLVLRFGVRRLGLGRARGPVRVLARCPLEPRRSLYVVQAAGRCFLVGAAEGGVTLLAELDADKVAAETTPPAAAPVS